MTTPEPDARSPDAESESLARLLKIAGRRPEPPADMKAAVRQSVETAWREQAHRHSRSKRMRAFALAASVIAGMAIAMRLVFAPMPAGTVEFANVERIDGAVEISGAGSSTWQSLSGTPKVHVGDRLRSTGNGRIALTTHDGRSVRIDRLTEIRFEPDNKIVLLNGRVFASSDERSLKSTARGIEIETPLGSVLEIGTQFEVRHQNNETRVRVREGRIQLENSKIETGATAGEQISLTASGSLSRGVVPPDSRDWDWTQAIAPPFELDGAALDAFLRWVSRETGQKIEFADAATESAVHATVLHGSVTGLLPGDALSAVLATTRFDYRVADGAIHIFSAQSR